MKQEVRKATYNAFGDEHRSARRQLNYAYELTFHKVVGENDSGEVTTYVIDPGDGDMLSEADPMATRPATCG